MAQSVYRVRLLAGMSLWTFGSATPVIAQSIVDQPNLTTQTPPVQTEQVEDIVVTGSRLGSRTGFTTPTPVTVLSAATIAQQTAPSQISDLLNQTPQFRPVGGANQSQYQTMTVGQAPVDLRGLGTVRTLVLIDGHRHVGTQANGTLDTNLIPIGLVDRIDIVTGGASAAYGSDAVAGVVNFVLKDRLKGFEGSIQYGVSQQGDDHGPTLSMAYGTSFLDGRLRLIAGADYSKTDGVGSLYTRDWGRSEPGIFSPSGRPAGVPAQLIVNNNEYNLTPGGIITAGPLRGTAFGAGGTPYAFQYGALTGTTEMQGTANYGFNELGNQYIRIPFQRNAELARVTFDADRHLTAYAEISAGHLAINSNTTFSPLPAFAVSINNPYLPAATRAAMTAAGLTTVRLGRLFTEWGATNALNKDDSFAATVGGKGDFIGGWKWDGYYEHGESKFDYIVQNVALVPNLLAAINVVPGVGGPVCGPIATNPNLTPAQRGAVSPGCVPFNIFGANQASTEAVNYVTARMEQHTKLTQDVAAFNLRGDLFSLPAGTVAVAVGAEWRKDKADVTVPADVLARSLVGAYGFGNPLPSSGSIEVKEIYGEALVPILADMAFAKALDLSLAFRATDYSTSGSVETWKVGLNYQINDSLRLRATQSRDIRAPNFAELYQVAAQGFSTQSNPSTNVSAGVITQFVSNPNLRPEKADTFTGGIVWQPKKGLFDGLRLSVDYFSIKIDDAITAVGFAEVLRRFYVLGLPEYQKYIVSAPTSTYPTGFSTVYGPYLNASAFKTGGVDIQADYRVPLGNLPGRLNLNIAGTWLRRLQTTDLSGTIDQAAAEVPKWRWTGNINYQVDTLTLNLQTRYSSAKKFSSVLRGPEDAGYDPALPTSINKNSFPSAVYFTLAATYGIHVSNITKFELFGVVDNLLDKDPPFGSYVLTQAGNNYYDLIGRTFKVGLRFKL